MHSGGVNAMASTVPDMKNNFRMCHSLSLWDVGAVKGCTLSYIKLTFPTDMVPTAKGEMTGETQVGVQAVEDGKHFSDH